MAAVNRRPALAARTAGLQLPPFLDGKERATGRSVSAKRTRSPERAGDQSARNGNPKRARSSTTTVTRPAADALGKRRKSASQTVKDEKFSAAYGKAFPNFVFYFDIDSADAESAALRKILESRVCQLGARTEDFFSATITHLITYENASASNSTANKENVPIPAPLSKLPNGKSPHKNWKPEELAIQTASFSLAKKALELDMKIWNPTKLASVIDRVMLNPSQPSPTPEPSHQRSLTRLLQDERLHGTSERDPTQKRHDFHYFSKNSYFVLVEDIRQELATITAFEYPIFKKRDGSEDPTWPVLHCHPKARGPFIKFDDKERQKYEKSLLDEDNLARVKEREGMIRERMRRRALQAHTKAAGAGDLRRVVSLNNIRRNAVADAAQEYVDLDADATTGAVEPANASGFMPSGTSNNQAEYTAASGNSVGITSNTGTTSTSGRVLRNTQLPAGLRGKMQQEIVTSRKISAVNGRNSSLKGAAAMAPPAQVPNRDAGVLKRSKSTNTMRLEKRDERVKPGYCESCRVKFDDFNVHIRCKRHRKFATNPDNFASLDFVLQRVIRRTVREVELERKDIENFAMPSSPVVKSEEEDVFFVHSDSTGSTAVEQHVRMKHEPMDGIVHTDMKMMADSTP